MRAVILGGGLAFILSIIGTPLAIKILKKRNIGQQIRADGPAHHQSKQGTPTMGGVVFIAATVVAYAIATIVSAWGHPERGVTATAVVLLGLFIGMGLVGFLDDFIKFRKRRSLGLNKKGKIAGQLLVSVLFGLLALGLPSEGGITVASTFLSFTRDISTVELTKFGAIALFVFVVISSANGVNLVDGLDGLATGASVMALIGYGVIGFWQFRHLRGTALCQTAQYCYQVRDPLDVSLIAVAAAGACFGFLWWNASPAKIFMGDTGALGLGGLLAGLAVSTRTTLLLPIMGVLFVIVTMSVIIQIASFRTTGRRVFRMAPLQHHFELAGWGEVTIVIRFWIIAGIGVTFALALFYADFVAAL